MCMQHENVTSVRSTSVKMFKIDVLTRHFVSCKSRDDKFQESFHYIQTFFL